MARKKSGLMMTPNIYISLQLSDRQHRFYALQITSHQLLQILQILKQNGDCPEWEL